MGCGLLRVPEENLDFLLSRFDVGPCHADIHLVPA